MAIWFLWCQEILTYLTLNSKAHFNVPFYWQILNVALNVYVAASLYQHLLMISNWTCAFLWFDNVLISVSEWVLLLINSLVLFFYLEMNQAQSMYYECTGHHIVWWSERWIPLQPYWRDVRRRHLFIPQPNASASKTDPTLLHSARQGQSRVAEVVAIFDS